MASKHCRSRLCSFVSLLIWYVLLATEKHPWGSSNEDKDFRTAWHWPSLKGWWRRGAAGQLSPLILQDLSGNTFHCKMNGCWLTLESLSYFLRFSSQGDQNSVSVHMGSELHSCALGSAQDLQISLLLLGSADLLYRQVCISSTLCIFCEQVTTKLTKLLQSIIMHKPSNSGSPVASTHTFRHISKLFMFIQGVLKTCLAKPVFSLTFLLVLLDIVTVLSLDLNIGKTVFLTVL